MDLNVDISIDEEFEELVQHRWFRQAIEEIVSIIEIDYEIEVSLLITGDEKMRELNNAYRDSDQTTDVLAFAFQEDDGSEFPLSYEGVSQLGEVIISYPEANRQAMERGHSLSMEMMTLTIHGVLHLLGYDHGDADDEALMKAKENVIMDRLNTK